MVSFDATRSCRKNKLDFINGLILVLEIIDLNCVVWERGHYFVHYWILNSINLMSVSKLCYSFNYVLQLFDNKYVLLDLKSQRMIGLAIQIEGLYTLMI